MLQIEHHGIQTRTGKRRGIRRMLGLYPSGENRRPFGELLLQARGVHESNLNRP